MAVPTPSTATASQFVTSTFWNTEIRDIFNFLLAGPRCFAYRNANLSTTSGTDTVFDMNAELYDPYATPAHDNTTNNTRMVAAETGIYVVVAQAAWASNATGRRQIQVRKNAAGNAASGTQLAIQSSAAIAGGFATRFGLVVEAQLTATDYVEMFCLQDSGGALNVVGSASDSFLSIRWVAKQ